MISGDNGLTWAARHRRNRRRAADRWPWRSGISGRMRVDRKTGTLAAALLLSALALGGCSISVADLPLVGTPADAPARPKEANGFLPVNDLPADRDEAAISPEERAK